MVRKAYFLEGRLFGSEKNKKQKHRLMNNILFYRFYGSFLSDFSKGKFTLPLGCLAYEDLA